MKEETKKKHPLRNLFLINLCICLALFLWAYFISPYGLMTKEYAVYSEKIPTSFNGLKIVHFSDIHYGRTIKKKELEKVVSTINELKPDIVVYTGDLFDKKININQDTIKEINIVLNKIEATLAKYAILGNHDYEHAGYKDLFSSFKVLDNSYDILYYQDIEPIYIAGVPSMIKDTINYDTTFTYLQELEEDKSIYQILLMHEPDNIKNFNDYNIDLILAGHSHGGQVRLPFIGKVITPLGSQDYYDEYYKVDKTDLYVSYGLGTSGFGIRFLNKPSINLYRLYKK